MPVERIAVTDRAVWLKMRQQDLTASDVGAAAGESRWKSRLQLWGEKSGMLLPPEDNPSMQRGRWLEPAVVAALKETHPDWEIGYPLGLYIRDPDLRLGCTPDAVAEIPGRQGVTNVQLKVVAASSYNGYWRVNGVEAAPLDYQLQAATEAMLMDTHDAMVAVLVIDQWGAQLKTFDVPRLPRIEEYVRDLSRRFWAGVKNGQRPPVDLTDAETLDAIFPVDSEPEVRMDHDNMLPGLLEERTSIKDTVRGLDERCDELDALIKDKIGPHTAITLPGWRVTWKAHTRKAYTVPEKDVRPLVVYDRRRKEGLLPADDKEDVHAAV